MDEQVNKIRAEIERRYNYHRDHADDWAGTSHFWSANEDKEILSFIDSLQEEPKTDWLQELQERLNSLSEEDFKKVWAKYKLREEGSVDYDRLNFMLDESLAKETKESWNKKLGEEPVSEDLENAALEYATHYDKNWSEVKDGYISENEVNAFKAGAKWQKERIMANSINATICLPYENKYGGYTHLIDVLRPLPVGNNKIAVIFKED